MTKQPYFKFIQWGVDPTDVIPRIINTCAIDTVLFIMYHMRRINSVVESELRQEDGIMQRVMQLLDCDKFDEARWYVAKENRELRYQLDAALSGGKVIDLYSGIGNWIWMFQCVTGYKRNSVLKCNTCDKYIQTEKMMQAIYLTKIDENINEELNNKIQAVYEQKCEENIESIDLDDVNVPVYDHPCSGNVRIQDNITLPPKILAIYGIQFDKKKNTRFIPFTALPQTMTVMGKPWILNGVVINNTSHFRALVPLGGTKWVVYCGFDKDNDYKLIDIEGYTTKKN